MGQREGPRVFVRVARFVFLSRNYSTRLLYSISWLMKCKILNSGYANCSDVFPIYIGDDRTDEDAFKVLCLSRVVVCVKDVKLGFFNLFLDIYIYI